MFYIPSFVWLLTHFEGVTGIFSTIECPSYPPSDYPQIHEYHYPPDDCALRGSHKDPFRIYSRISHADSGCSKASEFTDDDLTFDCYRDDERPCSVKLKDTVIKKPNLESSLELPCPSFRDSWTHALLPVTGNCSLFYKCNWGSAILFECPSELHFNAELQVCDWPWRAHCNFSWNDCPRPHPSCPVDYPRTLYLPHPHACDKFYQCDWGTSHLQSCPNGLHFNPKLKICDWPHRANCREC